MNLLISSCLNPYQNLATEEYLLKNSTEDYIFLYINQPSIVVGKHQNSIKEINSYYILDNNILVARRLSGGGAVFHDQGNLNFSFIQTLAFGENISYPKITHPIFDFLKNEVAPDLLLNERNDFILYGKKISGSAMHVFKNRVLAHGTLLINSNLDTLSQSLKSHAERFTDKSISSKRAEVMNLSTASNLLTAQTILQKFSDYLKGKNTLLKIYQADAIAADAIQKLAIEKYAHPDWIYGYSPKYQYHHYLLFDGKKLLYYLEIEKGCIQSVKFELNDEIDNSIKLKLNELTNKQHNIFALSSWLNSTTSSPLEKQIFHSLF